MTSNRPYLLRALYEWIGDNDTTAHLVIDARVDHTHVPQQFVDEQGHITLNIAPSAVRNLEISDEWVLFDARFSGQPMAVTVPMEAVRAIYARENGEGMVFPAEEEANTDEAASPEEESTKPPKPGRPTLKLVE